METTTTERASRGSDPATARPAGFPAAAAALYPGGDGGGASAARDSSGDDFGVSRRLAGRSAAALLVICGVASLVSMAQPVPGDHLLGELVAGLAVTISGLLLWFVPWERLPAPTTLFLVPVAFFFTALSNWAGGRDPWSYAVFFLVTFAWIGICHRPGRAAIMLPGFAVAYLVPLIVTHQDTDVALTSVVYVGLACLLVGESVAWVSASWRRGQADLRSHEAEKRLHALVQNASDVISIVTPEAAIRYCSPSVEQMLGYSADELEGTQFTALVHHNDCTRVERFLAECSSRADSTVVAEWRLVRKDRSSRQVETVAANLLDHPQVGGLVLTTRDITDRKALEKQLAHQALHDALTDLGNQTLFKERLVHALAVCRRRKTSLAVLFIDLDNFKAVNDGRGHTVGDEVLTQAACRLVECVRAADTVARLGGDEFAVLIEDLGDRDAAADAAARIVAGLGAPLIVRSGETVLGASIGIAVRSSDVDTAEDLMRNADVAMYVAKRNGKGRYEFFDPSMRSAVIARLELENDLRRALDTGELLMYYQPIIDLQTGAVHSLEALVRWQHPTRGLLLPEAFLPLAEETGLIVPIGRLAMDQACRQLRALRDANGGLDSIAISVNLSARQLQDPAIVDDLEAAITRAGVDPHCLILEITETTLVQDIIAAGRRLDALRALGIRIALDDFGTGYSSLSYLQRFRVDVLKVDRSFTSAQREGDDFTLTKAIIALGLALGLQTVAEGIEDAEEHGWMASLGCEYGQGFHFARPMAGDEVAAFLAGRS